MCRPLHPGLGFEIESPFEWRRLVAVIVWSMWVNCPTLSAEFYNKIDCYCYYYQYHFRSVSIVQNRIQYWIWHQIHLKWSLVQIQFQSILSTKHTYMQQTQIIIISDQLKWTWKRSVVCSKLSYHIKCMTWHNMTWNNTLFTWYI